MVTLEEQDGKPTFLRIGKHRFECEADYGRVLVPKFFLHGFRLSEIPYAIGVKPVERIEDSEIHVSNEVTFWQFDEGLAIAEVEEGFIPKYWEGQISVRAHVDALRRAIADNEATEETSFHEDENYIRLTYDVNISRDLEIQEAIAFVDSIIDRINKRTEQLLNRRKDRLLDVFDRASFDDDLNLALSTDGPVSLAFGDIDHFKTVNDTYGHLRGDDVLRRVANVLLETCDDSATTTAYRYGGEELAVILTGDDAAKAAQIAEKIRANVEDLNFEEPNLKVTISIGVAHVCEGQRQSRELIRRADDAVYRAKDEGRNRVVLSENCP